MVVEGEGGGEGGVGGWGVVWFFFFKQKTAYEMCGRDWSSDVCSSDLVGRTTTNPHSLPQVTVAIKEINEGLMLTTCGSYRRGQQTCGDVDILITHPDGRSHEGVFSKILNKLHDQGSL